MIDAAFAPALVGLNVTVTMQLPPIGTEALQVLVCAKSVAFVPEIVMALIVSAAVPGFVNVTFCAALTLMVWVPKLKVDELSVAAGVDVAAPVPVSPMFWGLPGPLSATLTDAVLEPVPVGLNVTVIVQLAPLATELPQVFVCAKSPGFAPASVMPVTDRAAVPLLVNVLDCAVLVLPTVWLGKTRLVGDIDTTCWTVIVSVVASGVPPLS